MHKENFVQKVNLINIFSSYTLKCTKGLQRNITGNMKENSKNLPPVL
jgi:hypothetical protein